MCRDARAGDSLTNEYAAQLLDLGLFNLIGGGVWPTSAISPEQLETDGPALADRRTSLVDLLRGAPFDAEPGPRHHEIDWNRTINGLRSRG